MLTSQVETRFLHTASASANSDSDVTQSRLNGFQNIRDRYENIDTSEYRSSYQIFSAGKSPSV